MKIKWYIYDIDR